MTKKEQTKDKIRKAAYLCVARYGFEKTTLDDIANEVNLNKASLYYYYKNKEDIFLDITTSATRAFFEVLRSGTLEIKGDVSNQIMYFLTERALYYLRMISEVHISEAALRQVEHLFYDQIKDVKNAELSFLTDLLDKAIQNDTLVTTDTARLSENLIAMSEAIKEMEKYKHQGWSDPSQLSTEITLNIQYMVGLIFKGLTR
jgi:AcrR family transcriptional regulator